MVPQNVFQWHLSVAVGSLFVQVPPPFGEFGHLSPAVVLTAAEFLHLFDEVECSNVLQS